MPYNPYQAPFKPSAVPSPLYKRKTIKPLPVSYIQRPDLNLASFNTFA